MLELVIVVIKEVVRLMTDEDVNIETANSMMKKKEKRKMN